MKCNKRSFTQVCFFKGFTLIELLVVVLIIGILTAVAVPQYQKSALKSRFSSLFPLGKSLYEANEVYYLNQGVYASQNDQLEITPPVTPVTNTLGNTDKHFYVKLTRPDIQNNLIFYQKHSPNFPDEIHCEAKQDDTNANWLCEKGLQGTFIKRALTDGYSTYVLQGNGNGNFGKTYYSNPTTPIIIEDGDTCVGNGAYDCGSRQVSNQGTCEGNGYRSCKDSKFDNYGFCTGIGDRLCENGTFTNFSSCEAWGFGGCAINVTYTNHSTCTGEGYATCGGTFTTYSSCTGNADRTCYEATFNDHSVCYANFENSCTNAHYDSTSCCSGKFCPSSAPKC